MRRLRKLWRATSGYGARYARLKAFYTLREALDTAHSIFSNFWRCPHLSKTYQVSCEHGPENKCSPRDSESVWRLIEEACQWP